MKNQKKQIQTLQKQISRQNKRARIYDEGLEAEVELQLEDTVQENIKLVKQECPKCRGNLENVALGNRVIITCGNCNYRTSKKI